MDKSFHHKLYKGCNYLSMLGLKLNYVSKGLREADQSHPIRQSFIHAWCMVTKTSEDYYDHLVTVICMLLWLTLFRWIHGVIKWKHFPRQWPFVRAIHRWPVNHPYKGQLRGALIFCLICSWTNGWINTRDAGDLSRHHVHYDVTVMRHPAVGVN